MAEYAWSESWVKKASTGTRAQFSGEAWQATATFTLTGEKASYSGVRPSEAFEPGKGKWGALELAAPRERHRDRDGGLRARGSWTRRSPCGRPSPGPWASTGTLNRNVKQVVDFERTTFTGGADGRRRPPGRERLLHPHPGLLLSEKGRAMNRTTTVRTTLAALAVLGLVAAAAPGPGAPQRLLRPDPRALPGRQRRLRRAVEGEDRQGPSRSSSPTAARASRPAPSSTASRPTW